jgi:ribonuclease I
MIRRAVLLLVFLQLGAADVTGAPRQVTGAGFNYYVLSLYWLPTLCLESPNADECGGPSRYGIVVRGLIPVLDWNSPMNCGGGDIISDSLVASLKDLMASRRVVEREWTVHGSCSGESPERFFALLRQAFDSMNLPRLNGTVLSKNLASNYCTGETIRSSCTTPDIQIPAAR